MADRIFLNGDGWKGRDLFVSRNKKYICRNNAFCAGDRLDDRPDIEVFARSFLTYVDLPAGGRRQAHCRCSCSLCSCSCSISSSSSSCCTGCSCCWLKVGDRKPPLTDAKLRVIVQDVTGRQSLALKLDCVSKNDLDRGSQEVFEVCCSTGWGKKVAS